jgi:hypothetical protein
MSEAASSIIVGTAGLTLAFLVSLVLAVRGPALVHEHASRLRPIAVASVLARSLHFRFAAAQRRQQAASNAARPKFDSLRVPWSRK